MASIKERLIQVVLRGKDLLSPEADKSKAALEALRAEGEKLRAELDKTKADTGLVRALDGLNKATERAERDLERAQKNVKQLQDELSKSPSSKGLEVSLKAAERESRRAATALDKVQQEASELAEKAKAAGIDTSKLSEEEKRLASQLDRTKSAIRDNSSETSSLRKEQAAAARSAAEQESRTKSLRSTLASTEKRVLAFAAAYISLNAAFRLVRKGIDLVAGGIQSVVRLGDSAEKTSQQLAGLMGGEEAGVEAGKWIEEFADKTGRRINDVTEAFVGLKAYGLDPMDGSLEALINKTTQLGGDASTLQGISLALGQMWAKEKIVQEEVNQLRERGVNAFDLLAKAMGKTTVQIQDMAAKGQLGRNEIKLLIDEIGRSADGAAAGALDTLSGKWNVLQNQFQKFGERIASSGVMELLNEKLQGVLDTVGELTEDGTLDNLAVAIADAFGQGAERVEEFVKSLAGVDFKNLIDQSAAWLSDFGSKIDSAVEAGQTASRVLTGVWHGFRALVTEAASGLTWLVNSTLGNLLRAAAAVTDALGLESATEKLKFATGFMEELQEAFADASKESWDKVGAAIHGTADAADAAADKQKDALDRQTEAYKKAQEEIEAVQAALRSAAEETAEAHRLAAVEGKRAFTDMADALDVIDSTDSVAELEKLRQTFLQAGKDGKLSQQEMEAAVSKTSTKIAKLGTDASGSAKDLKSLEGVMKAIKTAANDIDIRQAKSALDKLYREGAIDAKEHAQAQEALNKKVAELQPAAKKSAEAVSEMSSAAETVNQSITIVNNSMRQSGAMMSWMTGWINKVRGRLGELSESAVAAFNELRGIKVEAPLDTSSWEKTAEAAGKVRREAGLLRQQMWSLADSGAWLSNWAFSLRSDAKKVEASFLEQKSSVQRLMEQYDSGTISLQRFVSAASAVKNRSDLLGESDLSPLISAIQSARQQMDALADSTKSTLEQLNTELLELKGTQEEIEKNRFAGRRRELQAQLADAQQSGDQRAIQNLQQALRTLSEIEDERARQARNAKAEEAKKATEAQAQKAQQLPQAPQKVIRLEAPGGRAVNVAVGSDADETALLGILESYARRTGR